MRHRSTPRYSKRHTTSILAEAREHAPFHDEVRSSLSMVPDSIGKHQESPGIHDISYSRLMGYLTTVRNRLLITPLQQETLQKTVVAFFGLSVGSHAAVTWMMESRADRVKLMDPDKISPTNLNRLRSGWFSLGLYKVDVTAKEIQAIHPPVGITRFYSADRGCMKAMFDEQPVPRIVVDEIDDMSGKFYLRELCRQRRIPIISATDTGESVILDVERYDTDPNTVPFLGRVNMTAYRGVDLRSLGSKERMELVLRLVGLENCSNEMLISLLSIGVSLKTWPQLGATAVAAGGLVTTCLKKISLGEGLHSGRYIMDADRVFSLRQTSGKRKERRRLLAQCRRRFFG